MHSVRPRRSALVARGTLSLVCSYLIPTHSFLTDSFLTDSFLTDSFLTGHSSVILAAQGAAGGHELGAHARGPGARDGLQRRPAGAVVADQRRAVSLIHCVAQLALGVGRAWVRVYL